MSQLTNPLSTWYFDQYGKLHSALGCSLNGREVAFPSSEWRTIGGAYVGSHARSFVKEETTSSAFRLRGRSAQLWTVHLVSEVLAHSNPPPPRHCFFTIFKVSEMFSLFWEWFGNARSFQITIWTHTTRLQDHLTSTIIKQSVLVFQSFLFTHSEYSPS